MAEQIPINILKSVYSRSHARVLKAGEKNVMVWDDECAPWLRGSNPIAVRGAEGCQDESGGIETPGDAAGERGISKPGRQIRGKLAKPSEPVGENKPLNRT